MRSFPTNYLLLGALLAAGQMAAASQCVYRGTSADARVLRFSGEVLSAEAWTADRQCERMEVIAGAVRVIAQGPDGKLTEREVTRGTLLKPDTSMSAGLLRQISIVLAGDERARSGMSRASADFDALAEALPAGRIVDRARPIELVFPDPAAMKGAVLELSAAGRAPVNIPVVAGALRIPAAELRAGSDYQWRLRVQGTTLKGTFSVDSLATFTTARAAIDAAPAAAGDAPLRPLAIAERLVELGYVLESRAVLSEYFSR